MSRKTALELERLLRLRLAGERRAASRTALPAAEETLRAGSLPLERAAIALAGEAGRAESLREASAAESALAGNAALRSPAQAAARSLAAQSAAIFPAREAGGAQMNRAEAGLAGEAGRAESLWGASAAERALAGNAALRSPAQAAAQSLTAQDAAERGPAIRSAAIAPAREADSIPAERAASGLALAGEAGHGGNLREAPAAENALAGNAALRSPAQAAAQSAAERGPAIRSDAVALAREADSIPAERAASGLAGAGLALVGEAAPAAEHALAGNAALYSPAQAAAQSLTAQSAAGRGPAIRSDTVALLQETIGAPAERAAAPALARERGDGPASGSAPALADSPERNVRLLAALPENSLPDSGEAQLSALPRPAGQKKNADGAARSGEAFPDKRRGGGESGTEDFWGLWARRFAGELHSSAEGVHG